jgi:hypothetical protein
MHQNKDNPQKLFFKKVPKNLFFWVKLFFSAHFLNYSFRSEISIQLRIF